MATSTAADRRQRAARRRAWVGRQASQARTRAGGLRERLTNDSYRCGGCGAALPTASEVARHTCDAPAGGNGHKAKTNGGNGNGKTAKGPGGPKLRPAPPRPPSARGGGRVANPALHAMVKASQALTEVDLVDGKGRAVLTSDELDDLWLQIGTALTAVGDNLDQLADRFDRELRLDRRVTRPFHDAADAVGSDARELVRNARKALRRVYADRLSPGGKASGPASGFLPQ